MVRGLEADIDDIGSRFELPTEFVVPGPGPPVGAARRGPHRRAAGRAGGPVRARPRTPTSCPTSTACRRCCGSSPAGPRARRCPLPSPTARRAPRPRPGGPRCPSPSSSPAPLPPTWPPSAVGVVAGQTEGAGVDWAYLAGQGFEAKKGDVRAAAGRRRHHHLRRRARPGRRGRRRRAAASPPARWPAPPSGTPSLAVDLLGAAADGTSAAAGAQAIAEGLVLGGYQFSDLQVRAEAVRARARRPRRRRRQARAGRDRARAHAGRGGVLGARPRERAGRLAHPDGAGQAGRRGGRAAPASRSPCGTRRRSASRSSAASSA